MRHQFNLGHAMIETRADIYSEEPLCGELSFLDPDGRCFRILITPKQVSSIVEQIRNGRPVTSIFSPKGR